MRQRKVATLEYCFVQRTFVYIERAGMRIALSVKPPLKKIVDIERLDEVTMGVSYSDLTNAIYRTEQLTQRLVYSATKQDQRVR